MLQSVQNAFWYKKWRQLIEKKTRLVGAVGIESGFNRPPKPSFQDWLGDAES
jgi:hypothetical protein